MPEPAVEPVTCVGMTAGQIRAALRAQGCLLLREVLARPLMERLRDELDQARRREEERFGLEMLDEIGQRGYVSDFLAIGAALEEVLDSEALHTVLDAVFGEDDARLYVGQGIILDPGMGRGVWPRCWHADMYGPRQDLGDPGFCFGVNCLLLVDDLTPENGPTGVLPGSHGLESLHTQREDDLDEIEVRATAPAGSLLLLDGGVWHSAGFNRSNASRRVVKMLFTRRWIRPQIDYPATAAPEVAARLSPRVRRLLRFEDGGVTA
jgi:hypothetical protein